MIMYYVTQLLLSIVCVVMMSGTLRCIEPSIQKFDGQILGCDRNKIRKVDFFFTKPNQKKAFAVLEDKDGKKFIVKQRVQGDFPSQLCVAREATSVFLAQAVGILANSLAIIPAFYEFPGKRDSSLPATLHNFVPGCQVSQLPSDLRKFQVDIKQQTRDIASKNERGLTRHVISNMAKHEDLPFLVGFDTFVGNGGRGNKNIFYDKDSNHYYAIDFGDCFEKNLGLYACDNIQVMIDDKSVTFSQQEIQALKIYKNALARLIKLYTVEDMHEKLITYAIESGVMPQETRANVATKLLSYKEVMIENYESCKQLVVLLDELIMKHR